MKFYLGEFRKTYSKIENLSKQQQIISENNFVYVIYFFNFKFGTNSTKFVDRYNFVRIMFTIFKRIYMGLVLIFRFTVLFLPFLLCIYLEMNCYDYFDL